MNSDDLQALLGAAADSPEVVRFLVAFAVNGPIRLPRDDTEAAVMLPGQGLRLVFEPAGPKTSRLRLTTVEFYAEEEEGVAEFGGRLPAGLAFSDDATAVRKRLGKPAKTSKHVPYDTWHRDAFSLAVRYTLDKRRIRVVSITDQGGRPIECASMMIDGDELLPLLGLRHGTAEVRATLERLARGMQPKLDPEADEDLVDWVTVNEIGLEFGFEDEAYVRALDPELRGTGPLVLTQLYFYGDTPTTQPFAGTLPFGLTFSDDRGGCAGSWQRTRRRGAPTCGTRGRCRRSRSP